MRAKARRAENGDAAPDGYKLLFLARANLRQDTLDQCVFDAESSHLAGGFGWLISRITARGTSNFPNRLGRMSTCPIRIR